MAVRGAAQASVLPIPHDPIEKLPGENLSWAPLLAPEIPIIATTVSLAVAAAIRKTIKLYLLQTGLIADKRVRRERRSQTQSDRGDGG